MALRFGAKVPELHEDSPLARLWIDKIADLPAAQRQGRLADAVIDGQPLRRSLVGTEAHD